ncbi:MAG: hypothetical protein SGARI_000889, partial [Bacillariaceae sp.]
MSFSKQHGLVTHVSAKSASTTVRLLMERKFKAEEQLYCPWWKEEKIKRPGFSAIQFAFFRNPMTRFFSGFLEITLRIAENRRPVKVPQQLS